MNHLFNKTSVRKQTLAAEVKRRANCSIMMLRRNPINDWNLNWNSKRI